MSIVRRLVVVAIGALVSVAVSGAGLAQTQTCTAVGTSTKQVVSGVTLTWESSFRCTKAPDSGSYSITVRVSSVSASAQSVSIGALRLSHATPRPRGQSPVATANASGLPLTLAPGASGSFGVSGTYTLVSTGEGKKANLHLRALGRAVASGDPFRLGINVHLRAPGAVEDAQNGRGGPPPWAGGPPPWAGPPPGVPGRGRP